MATTNSTQTAKPVSAWESTKTQHLIRYQPSGVYFAKVKAGGKQFRFSLHTTVRSVAEARLDDERRKRVATASKPTTGRLPELREALRRRNCPPMKPSIWISPDARYIVALDKVAAVRPENGRGFVLVLLRGGKLLLDAANAHHFKEALLRFHNFIQPQPCTNKTQS